MWCKSVTQEYIIVQVDKVVYNTVEQWMLDFGVHSILEDSGVWTVDFGGFRSMDFGGFWRLTDGQIGVIQIY